MDGAILELIGLFVLMAVLFSIFLDENGYFSALVLACRMSGRDPRPFLNQVAVEQGLHGLPGFLPAGDNPRVIACLFSEASPKRRGGLGLVGTSESARAFLGSPPK
jgi:hypothetical protein